MAALIQRRTTIGVGLGAAMTPAVAFAASKVPRRPVWISDNRKIPWQSSKGLHRRVLNVDGAAEICVLKLDPGTTWIAGQLTDIFVLHGAIICAEGALARYGYARVAGQVQAPVGATLLIAGGAPGTGLARDSWDLPWKFAEAWEPLSPSAAAMLEQPGRPLTPEQPTNFVKVLSENVRLCAMLPTSGAAAAAPFAAASDLDFFLLQGEAEFGETHRLSAGGYACFPRGEPCGPWSTRRGFVALLRWTGPSGKIKPSAAALGNKLEISTTVSAWANSATGDP